MVGLYQTQFTVFAMLLKVNLLMKKQDINIKKNGKDI